MTYNVFGGTLNLTQSIRLYLWVTSHSTHGCSHTINWTGSGNQTKHKPTSKPCSLLRSGHVSVFMTVHNCSTQYSTEQFW